MICMLCMKAIMVKNHASLLQFGQAPIKKIAARGARGCKRPHKSPSGLAL